MSKTNEPPLTTHTYDGIQEYDNPMPGWWSFLFIACVVWGVVYWIAITVDLLPTYETEFAAEMEIQRKLEEAAKANLPPITPQMLAEAQGDEAVAAHGAEVFAMHCATCHGKLGEGQIGPNLTDTAWIVGDDSLASIHKTVQRGTPNGMPQWGSILPQPDILGVVVFTKSLQGTNPPNAKPPQGVTVGAGDAPKQADDAKTEPPQGAADGAEEAPPTDG